MEVLSSWNEERKNQLEQLYRKGLSFSLIARDIGVTRNAAIGKAHRMKLQKRIELTQCLPPRPRNPNLPKRRRRRTGTVVMGRMPPPVVIDTNRDYRCTINSLDNQTCRYPCWGLSDAHHERLYCGCPGANLAEGFPYCERHTLLCETSHK